MLLNDGTGWVIFAPVNLSNTPDYAVEAEIQVIEVGAGCQSHLGFLVRTVPNEEPLPGYMIGWINMFCRGQGFLGIARNIMLSEPWNAEWDCGAGIEPDSAWHKYRVEVSANEIRLLVDDQAACAITDNRYLEGAGVGLWGGASFSVRNFRVLPLVQQ